MRVLTYMRVSIHAPREGCDPAVSYSSSWRACFNSRTPGGVRHSFIFIYRADDGFQFTHPGRGATFYKRRSIKWLSAFQFTHPGRGATL